MNIFFLLLSFALAYTPPEKKPSFSQMEINHIRVTTPGLFDNEKLLELHLEQIPDTAYCFPLPGGKVISPYGRGVAVTRVLISKLAPKTRYAVLSMALYVCRSPTVLTAT